jgi:cytochrome c-type biogenesis protein CcmH
MILFWIIAGVLLLVALVVLLKPLMRVSGESGDEGKSIVAVFRRQLADIESETVQGRLATNEAAEARAEVTRRMLATADQQAQGQQLAAGRSREMSWRIGAMVGIAAVVPAAGLAVYSVVGSPAAIDPASAVAANAGAAGQHDRAELSAAADQLKARLDREPGHVEGWVLLGRTFASLERFADARDAYTHAIALAPDQPSLHAELGEVLVGVAGGRVTREADSEFGKAGSDPRARFYEAEAALQRGDREGARSAFRALLADAPVEAPWRKVVQQRLAEIAPGEAPTGAPGAPASQSPAASPLAGPTAQDAAAAQAMSPEERQAMIRSMVDRLAARLQQNPNDKEGWIRLAHAYDVLGETEKAAAARAHAAQLPAGN